MAATELRRIIQAHVDPQHREQATKLLDAILAGGAHIGGPGLMPSGMQAPGVGGQSNSVGGLFTSGGRGNGGDVNFVGNSFGGNGQHQPMGWGGSNSGPQAFTWGGAGGFGVAGSGNHVQSWPDSGFGGGWGIAPGIGSGGTTPLGVGGTGTSSLDGDVDQAMLNLALDAPAPAVFGGVSWNANPVPSFDLVDSSSSTTESRFGAVFQIPPSSSEVQIKSQDPTAQPAQAPSPQAQQQQTPPALATAPAAPAQSLQPAKFSSVVGGTAVGARPQAPPPAPNSNPPLPEPQKPRPSQASMAMQREAVAREEAKRTEAARVVASANKVDSKGGNTPKVKLRGLPYGSTMADVYNFFRGFGVIDGSVTFGVNSEGRPSGEAWVSFVKLEDARRAVREKDRHHMGDRYVELFLLNEGGGVANRGYTSK